MKDQAKEDHRRNSENDAAEFGTLPAVHVEALDAEGAQRRTQNDLNEGSIDGGRSRAQGRTYGEERDHPNVDARVRGCCSKLIFDVFAEKGQVSFDQQSFDDGTTCNAHEAKIQE